MIQNVQKVQQKQEIGQVAQEQAAAQSGPSMQRGVDIFADQGIAAPKGAPASVAEGSGLVSRFVEVIKDGLASLLRVFESKTARVKRRVDEAKEDAQKIPIMKAQARKFVEIYKAELTRAEKSLKESEENFILAQQNEKPELMAHWSTAGGKAELQVARAVAKLQGAEQNYEKVAKMAESIRLELEHRIEEANDALAAHEMESLKSDIASTMSSLDSSAGAIASDLKELQNENAGKRAYFDEIMDSSGAVARYETEQLREQAAAKSFADRMAKKAGK